MSHARQCQDCDRVRPVEAFYKTQGGAGRSARCRDCIESRAAEHRIETAAARKQEDEEVLDFLSSGGLSTELSPDQWLVEGRLNRGGPKNARRCHSRGSYRSFHVVDALPPTSTLYEPTLDSFGTRSVTSLKGQLPYTRRSERGKILLRTHLR